MTRTVAWALPLEIATADAGVVRAFDASVRGGEVRAEGQLACRVGCTCCCMGPFEITALDPARLIRGVAEMTLRDPDAGPGVVRRASEQWKRIAGAFPGDPTAGLLAADEPARTAFFARFAEMPCPALDPATRSCLVYTWRPLSCRTYGLPVRHGPRVLEPCPLNFTSAPADFVAGATIEPDPDDHEGRLLDRAREAGVAGDTIVCAALADVALE